MGLFAKPEFWAIVLIGFVLFGAKRLPEAGSAIGKTIKEFQKSLREVNEPEQPAVVTPPAQPQQLAASSTVAPAASTTGTPTVSETVADHPTTPAQ